MAPKTIQTNLNDELDNVDMIWQERPALEKGKEIEPMQIKAQREKEKKYGEWAEAVLAGKTNLSLIDWLYKHRSKCSQQ